YEYEINQLMTQLLSTQLGAPIKAEYVPGQWAELPNLLKAHSFDIIGSSWTPTPETQDLLWSDSYHEWGLMVSVRKDSPYKTVDEVKKLKVGRYDDPTSKDFFDKNGFTNVVTFSTQHDG